MATAKMTIEEMKKAKSKTDWKRIDALTDADINAGIAADPDTYEASEADSAKMRPAAETHPEIVTAYKRTRGNQKGPLKTPVSIRLNRAVVNFFKAHGSGWQTEINDILQKHVDSQHSA